jgi:glycosyltransferase involved in cell wall biosynthesis
MVPGRPLTVLQILPALESGGVERGTLEVAEALVARGHRALVASAGGRLVPALEAAGARHLALPLGRKSPRVLSEVARLRGVLRQEPVDILHARSRLPAWVGWWALRGLPVEARPRFVTTVHGLYRPGRYSAVMTRGERVIAVSHTVREYLLRHYPEIEPARIRVIHRGVDPAAFPYRHRPSPQWWQAWRERHPELEGRAVLALPGRLTRLKGHDDFLEILARLLDRGLEVRGLVVGGGRPRHVGRITRAVVRRDLPVTLAGPRDDIRDVLASTRVVLSLSRHPESFGRTVLEALSLGVPVVGYDLGGVGEVLARAFPAGRVPAGDVGAAASRVAHFLAEPPEVPPDPGFPLTRMLEDTLALYEEVAE